MAYTSPGRREPSLRRSTSLMDSPMDPRWTGMWGALATRPPSASNSAHEKSSRSLMLTECAVFCSRTPICSAIDMKRLLNTSSMTGSTRVPTAVRSGRGSARRSTRCPDGPAVACQPGSTTVVASSSATTAGPVTVSFVRSVSRRYRPASRHPSPANIRTVPSGRSGPPPARAPAARGGVCGPAAPVASTETASTTRGLSMANPYRARWTPVNSSVMAATVPWATGRAASVPA